MINDLQGGVIRACRTCSDASCEEVWPTTRPLYQLLTGCMPEIHCLMTENDRVPNEELAEGRDSPPCGLKSSAKTKHSTEGESIKWDRRT